MERDISSFPLGFFIEQHNFFNSEAAEIYYKCEYEYDSIILFLY